MKGVGRGWEEIEGVEMGGRDWKEIEGVEMDGRGTRKVGMIGPFALRAQMWIFWSGCSRILRRPGLDSHPLDMSANSVQLDDYGFDLQDSGVP